MKRLLILGLLPLSACYPAALEQPSAASYRALGTEPFWSLTVADGTMTYEAAGGPTITVPAPARQDMTEGYRLQTERLAMQVTRQQCSDGMSDRVYADTVRVSVDGRTLNGCGGAILPQTTIAGTNWSIINIDGEPVAGDDYSMSFTADRLTGKAGCNGFFADYQLSGQTITAGPVGATRMACQDPRMRHETKTLQILDGAVEVSMPDGDTMVLQGSSGRLTLRRSI